MTGFFSKLGLFVVFIGLGAVTGWFAAPMFQTPQWKSVARFEAPKVVDLGNYYSLYGTYNLVKGVPEQSRFDEEITQRVYQEFKRNLTSPDILQHFLVQHETVKQIAARQHQPVAMMAQSLIQHFQLNESQNSFSLTFTNPEEATRLLSEFIRFAAVQTRVVLNDELIAKWKILFQQVKQSAEQNLGAIQQGAQIAQQDWNGKLNIMRSVQPLDDRLQPFRFIKSPTVPQQTEPPSQQIMYSVMGGVTGFMVAVIALFFISRRKAHKD